MKTSNELHQWLPADERLANAICHGATVFVKNAEGFTGTIDKAVVKELCGCPNLTAIDALQTLVQHKIQYLPPTVPVVKELPDSDGVWWWWCAELNCWIRRNFEIKDPVARDTWTLEKGYFIKIPYPDFNPVTGEKL